ncbi:NmrA family NAD(P)-binding protein [Pendulispora albinea]|uniref:NmrA family NAD(P)-binding protein n=1 Tax=Pendulispora albinea TaxID=2741071 RepID=A0ABZ2M477_9BACT
MSGSRPVVLVVGAPGRFAGLVVPELARRGAVVRALVQHEHEVDAVRANGAAEIAVGDLRDGASLDAAVRGAFGVFHIGPAFVADEAELGLAMVAAAQRGGVRKFVFSSVIQPTNFRLKNHATKQPVEEALFGSGLEYTILQPTNFFQNIGGAWSAVLSTGVFAEPFPKTARVARVDYRDVAEVAAIALTSDRLTYGTFELCEGTMPNREDIAAMMSHALGRRIEAGEPTFKAWAQNANLPYDLRQRELLARVFEHYGAHGSGGNGLVLRAILGRAPRTLPAYIDELARAAR